MACQKPSESSEFVYYRVYYPVYFYLIYVISLTLEEQKKTAYLRDNLNKYAVFLGGDKQDRTTDLLNAIQALSQTHRLHTPVNGFWKCASIRRKICHSNWTK